MTQQKPYLLRCGACGARNRIPADKVGETAKCGRCKQPMPTAALNIAYPVVVTDNDFEEKVLRSPLPVLLDCWAPWCGPCQAMGSVLVQLASEWRGRIRVCKLNVDQNQRTAGRFQILSIPTLLIFENGKLQDSLAGAYPRQAIVQAMSPYLVS